MTGTENQKRLVIVGATGMVGAYALHYALDHPAVEAATAIGRKPTGLTHPKLKEVLHQDFADCSALAGALTDQDAAVFCQLWPRVTREWQGREAQLQSSVSHRRRWSRRSNS